MKLPNKPPPPPKVIYDSKFDVLSIKYKPNTGAAQETGSNIIYYADQDGSPCTITILDFAKSIEGILTSCLPKD